MGSRSSAAVVLLLFQFGDHEIFDRKCGFGIEHAEALFAPVRGHGITVDDTIAVYIDVQFSVDDFDGKIVRLTLLKQLWHARIMLPSGGNVVRAFRIEDTAPLEIDHFKFGRVIVADHETRAVPEIDARLIERDRSAVHKIIAADIQAAEARHIFDICRRNGEGAVFGDAPIVIAPRYLRYGDGGIETIARRLVAGQIGGKLFRLFCKKFAKFCNYCK